MDEEFPTLKIVRRIEKDRSLYFGPYPSATSLRQTLRLIRRLHFTFSPSLALRRGLVRDGQNGSTKVGRTRDHHVEMFEKTAKDRGFYSKHLMTEIAQRGSLRDIKGIHETEE
jgi:hypothetical protein